MRSVFQIAAEIVRKIRVVWLQRTNDLRCRVYRQRGYRIGKQVYLGPHVRLGRETSIGDQTSLMGDSHLQGQIQIGSNVIISTGATILAVNHEYDLGDALPYGTAYNKRKVTIGDNVWIGTNVQIIPGVTIGDGAVIGMGSVVTQDIPSLAVAAGNPARVIKSRDRQHYQRLLDEGKFLNRIRTAIPGGAAQAHRNRAAFERQMAECGFMLHADINTQKPEWRSAVLYELAIHTPGVVFGNAGKFHIALKKSMLGDLSACTKAVVSAIHRVDPGTTPDTVAIRADLEKLAKG